MFGLRFFVVFTYSVGSYPVVSDSDQDCLGKVMSVLRQCFWYFAISFTLFLGLSLYDFYYGFNYTGLVGNLCAGNLHHFFGHFSLVFLVLIVVLLFMGFSVKLEEAKPVLMVPLIFVFALFLGALSVIFSKLLVYFSPEAYLGLLNSTVVMFMELSFGVLGSLVASVFVLCLTSLLISEMSGVRFDLITRFLRVIYTPFSFVAALLRRAVSFLLKKKIVDRTLGCDLPVKDKLNTQESPVLKGSVDGGVGATALVDLLSESDNVVSDYTDGEVEAIKENVTDALQDFGIKGVATDVVRGSFVTMVHVELAKGARLSSVTSLSDDLARSLGVETIRIVSAVAGAGKIGIELPNIKCDKIYLKPLIQNSAFVLSEGLPIALGLDSVGNPFIFDLEKLPHMLVGGSTGSGKSVCLDIFILSLISKFSPEDLRLILIDPKMTEFASYASLPHLLVDVISDMNRAKTAFDWLIVEMETRYKTLLDAGVRNIKEFNLLPDVEKMSRIVVVVDEFADLILVVGKSIETSVQRLAQKSRACGIHLVIATQRPSADVITGLIKSNIPGRLALKVSSKINSRTILEQSGAEQLTSVGDMLVSLNSSTLTRVHCAYVPNNEIKRIVALLATQEAPEKVDIQLDSGEEVLGADVLDASDLAIYKEVIDFLEAGKTYSISGIQRRFRIGYNRSARLFEKLESDGYIYTSPAGKKIASNLE